MEYGIKAVGRESTWKGIFGFLLRWSASGYDYEVVGTGCRVVLEDGVFILKRDNGHETILGNIVDEVDEVFCNAVHDVYDLKEIVHA